MKNFILSFLLILTALPAFAAEEGKESVYERVMETKTLRCGYLAYEPWFIIDPNTEKISGIFPEYMESVAARKGIKIDWAQDTNIDQAIPSLNAEKIDAFCIPNTPDSIWIKMVEFSAHLGALPYYIYVPEKSTIMKDEIKTARLVIQDGFALSDVTRYAFPDAKYVSLQQTASPAEFYDQLRYGKADALVNEPVSAELYIKNNPNIIRRYSNEPVIAMSMFLVSRKDDLKMRDFLDQTFNTDDPENLSLMKKALASYKMAEDSLLLGKECANRHMTKDDWAVCTQPVKETPTGKNQKEK